MRPLFNLLTIILAVAGFFMPLLWVLAAITAFLAIGSSSGKRRVDGKGTTGGLLGSVWDMAVIDHKKQKGMIKEYPYCKSILSGEATKCKSCGEWLIKKESRLATEPQQKTQAKKFEAKSKTCNECMHENSIENIKCSRCETAFN